jgi:sugar phosphate isomerase/epimerase
MIISCCSWALSGSEQKILEDLASVGLRHIDFRPFDFTSDDMRAYMAEVGLKPTCMATAFGMPDGVALDSVDSGHRMQALKHTQDALDYAGRLCIDRSYLLPGETTDADALDRYQESVTILADYAQQLNIKLCIEHFPDKALPTVIDTLDFIDRCGHENLYLLFDIGHAQISKESPVEVIKKAGPRLGYVHLDDNDGQSDLHWPLYDGILTENLLKNTLDALGFIQYNGPVSLEIHPTLPNPLAAIQKSFGIIRSFGANT